MVQLFLRFLLLIYSCNDLADIVRERMDENFIVTLVKLHQCKEIYLTHRTILVVVEYVKNHALQQIHL